ncbi:hypothetical protein RSOLAG1IB_11912 [Rhizoctonia solani AG-1 IB]|uniref:Protein kinase domain-containing protein n=1 Tax=Thanatephorus cucumeris (strain AG1-IB / isolate 7/3/14) TaxID=1108050 RepID=A0A0B7FE70_THACB|nr:hypothetical protein RSOLAG1IB_11912 [Rhizoctonia solani AG-1 IB]
MGRPSEVVGSSMGILRLPHDARSSAVQSSVATSPALPNRNLLRPQSPPPYTDHNLSNMCQILAGSHSSPSEQASSPTIDPPESPTVSPSRNINQDDGLLMSKRNNSRITPEMSVHQILEQLCSHGIIDISRQLVSPERRGFPIATGGFGDIYHGALRDGREVSIKCLRPIIYQANGMETLKVRNSTGLLNLIKPNPSELVGSCLSGRNVTIRMFFHYLESLNIVDNWPWFPLGCRTVA